MAESELQHVCAASASMVNRLHATRAATETLISQTEQLNEQARAHARARARLLRVLVRWGGEGAHDGGTRTTALGAATT
eukprot:5118497-Pleurochrysis_carterae.AAC.3